MNYTKLEPSLFQHLLLSWFDENGRKNLPWQQNKTPYRVWVSEIMLQQTQVSAVIPYFEKFMQAFPQIEDLANAHEDEVLHLWTGLGYYSRARNLQRSAKKIMTDFAGQFPDNAADLETLPGIGPSTAAAILSLAYNQPAAILDGNVKRVLTRLHGITTPINEKSTEKQLWQIATAMMPATRCADYTQAIMDLGATLCVRGKPQCYRCSFLPHCLAYEQNIAAELPRKTSSKRLPVRSATFFVFQKNNFILLSKRPAPGIWGGLWSFPEMSVRPDAKIIQDFCFQHFRLTPKYYQAMPSFRHTFSHFHLDIFPVIIPVSRLPGKVMEASQQIWYNLDKPQALGLPKPVQLILRTCHEPNSTMCQIK